MAATDPARLKWKPSPARVQFHGDLYEFLRNDAFNATPEFDTSVPAYKKHDFGFTIGGPVYIPGHYNTNKQKTFFFWSEEWRRELTPASGFFSVTTSGSDGLAERGWELSATDCSECQPELSVAVTARLFPVHKQRPGLQHRTCNWFRHSPRSHRLLRRLMAMIPAPNIASGARQRSSRHLVRHPHTAHPLAPGTFQGRSEHQRQGSRQLPLHPRFLESAISRSSVDGRHQLSHDSDQFHQSRRQHGGAITANVSPTLLNEFVASYTTDHIGTQLTGPWQRPSGFPATWPLQQRLRRQGSGHQRFRWTSMVGALPKIPAMFPRAAEFEPHIHLPRQCHQNRWRTQSAVRRLFRERPQERNSAARQRRERPVEFHQHQHSYRVATLLPICCLETSAATPRRAPRSRCTSNTKSTKPTCQDDWHVTQAAHTESRSSSKLLRNLSREK